ncbi:cytochrome b/b6 domain-containing protein [Aestuariirhabdus sp. Z084]|uniref:cytochrome b/b6 domain-containing protein n=1 Tax=Aestuariirhabdus haliotis TaxID=2918751 RepID=UPI00201B3FAB|nr:cytochrome b/b6 domain-containing protein [Aestuariirhabdus haliotis]MCL6414129.1 cytochrome b/b6 domain-containing protein [Aestuariirhabdus haliotis]MCL6418061.1 cytochrome b/b6 domain-containing protein [Aestuariirhabdus haliotis]
MTPDVPTWDLPTRLFHWLLVILIANAWVTWKWGDINMLWHMWNGYSLLTLIVFRLLWGIWGSSTARFTQFIRGPKQIIAYLKRSFQREHPRYLGHNPAGALSVVLLLSLVGIQGSFGLFTSDDILVEGPLAYLVSTEVQEWLAGWHRQGFYIILAVVGLHILAVLGHLLLARDNLVRPMINGKKSPSQVPDGEMAQIAPLWLAALTLTLAAGLVWLGVNIWTW